MAAPINAKLAVLIDADNAQASKIGQLLAEVANKYGTAHVKRAYGDWTGTSLKGWKEPLLKFSIQPMQQFAYTVGKNATDAAMVIDAMDLLYTGRFDGFCIVSSDSDFTRLASRIRENGLVVYGFGERKTPKPFVTACDKFIYVENLSSLTEAAPLDEAVGAVGALRRVDMDAISTDIAEPTPALSSSIGGGGSGSGSGSTQHLLSAMLREAVNARSDDDGWAALASIGHVLTQRHSDFDPRTYGFDKLSDLIASNPLFEMTRRLPGEGKPLVIYVRYRKRGGPAQSDGEVKSARFSYSKP
jgi:uncharacterized LabA/DUF88 family protein